MRKKALIVEDNNAMRSIIASALEANLSLETFEAENGFSALKLLPEVTFDIILTDINMPDINGLELISFLRNHPAYKSIPIIIISTEGSEEDRKRGLALGASGYLVKPFTENQLSSLVKEVFEKAN